MNLFDMHSARRIRSEIIDGEREFFLDGQCVCVAGQDHVYVDRGEGWELAFADIADEDDPPHLMTENRLLVRFVDDDGRTLMPVVDSWRIALPRLIQRPDGSEVYVYPGYTGGAS